MRPPELEGPPDQARAGSSADEFQALRRRAVDVVPPGMRGVGVVLAVVQPDACKQVPVELSSAGRSQSPLGDTGFEHAREFQLTCPDNQAWLILETKWPTLHPASFSSGQLLIRPALAELVSKHEFAAGPTPGLLSEEAVGASHPPLARTTLWNDDRRLLFAFQGVQQLRMAQHAVRRRGPFGVGRPPLVQQHLRSTC